MKKGVINCALFSIVIVGIMGFSKNVDAATFSRPLQLGSMGSDVRELQKILNSDPETQITSSGVGAPGNESTYFGGLTRSAVIRFQNKYRQEILVPSGLSRGNGLVGPNTLKKLNSMGSVAGITKISPEIVVSPSTIIQNTPLLSQNDPYAAYKVKQGEAIDIYQTDRLIDSMRVSILNEVNNAVSQRRQPVISNSASAMGSIAQVVVNKFSALQGRPGTTILIAGKGFTSLNDVYFGPNYVVRDVKGDGTSLSLKVPTLPAGKYDVVIKNSFGVSNSGLFVIKDYSSKNLEIYSVLPEPVPYGGYLTISGSGFTSNNTFISTFGKIDNIASSDGKSIHIKIEPEALRAVAQAGKQGKTWTIEFNIINDNGVSPRFTFNVEY